MTLRYVVLKERSQAQKLLMLYDSMYVYFGKGKTKGTEIRSLVAGVRN